jgi:hypothetical protein
VGIESALVIRPYLERMTRSELLLVLTTGMATVASSTLGRLCSLSHRSFPTNSRTPDLCFCSGDSCLRRCLQSCSFPKPKRLRRSRPVPRKRTSRPASKNLISAIIEGAMEWAEAGGWSLGTTHRNSGNRSVGRQNTRRRQFVVGNERTALVVRILSWAFLSFRLSAWTANERCANSARLVGRSDSS